MTVSFDYPRQIKIGSHGNGEYSINNGSGTAMKPLISVVGLAVHNLYFFPSNFVLSKRLGLAYGLGMAGVWTCV